jgi:hypothetical protein
MRRHFPGGPVFEAAAEPGPLSPDYVAPEEPAAAEPEGPPEWFSPYQERFDQFTQSAEQLAFVAQQLQAQQQPQSREPWDPFAENAEEGLRNIIREELTPYQYARQTWEQQEGNERARDVLQDNISREGEFILEGSQDRALRLAEAYLPEMQERYGATAEAAEQAINAAAAETREYERQVGEAYHARQMNQLKTLNDAPREPGAVAPAVQTTGPAPTDEMAVVAKYGGWGH